MKKIFGLIVLLALVAGGTWFLALQLQSPQQVAAQAEPPEPQPVISELSRGYLHKPISVRVEAKYAKTHSIRAPESLTGVVTGVEKKRNDSVKSGDVLLRINGAPVFVLEGPFALYRDITAGDTGDDVKALQTALKDAGYPTGYDREGVYGPGTQSALRRMYQAFDLTVPTDQEVGEESIDGEEVEPAPARPVVKQSQIVMVPKLPATISRLPSVGTDLTGEESLAELGSGGIRLSADVPINAVSNLQVGAVGTFVDAEGESQEVEVSALESGDEDAAEVRIQLTTEAKVPVGEAVVVTIENPGGEEEQSLLAPHAGIVERGGNSYIYVAQGNIFREVKVTIVGSSGGVAAIETDDESVDEGTEIRVE